MNSITTTNGTNGNGKRQAEITPLPEHLEKQAQAFFSNYLARENELDTTKRLLAAGQIRISELEAELEAMKRERVMLESRATTCLLQRDEAKDAQVSLATIINSIQKLIGDLGVPSLAEQAQMRANAADEAAEG